MCLLKLLSHSLNCPWASSSNSFLMYSADTLLLLLHVGHFHFIFLLFFCLSFYYPKEEQKFKMKVLLGSDNGNKELYLITLHCTIQSFQYEKFFLVSKFISVLLLLFPAFLLPPFFPEKSLSETFSSLFLLYQNILQMESIVID